MDLHQWINEQNGSEQHPSVKMPRHHFDLHQQQSADSVSVLPLFAPADPNPKSSSLSLSPSSASTFPKMGGYFSLAQWQELELQALIYRHMLAGSEVPQELIQSIKKSLFNNPSSPYFRTSLHLLPQTQQSWYWGRAAMDPEPGRCRRTDGKKWRCSKDAVAGHKYCDRHIHRGKNRSRKPVEIPTGTLTSAAAASFSFSEAFPSGMINFDQRLSESRNDGRILRRFFDDWPRSLDDGDGGNPTVSPSSLTISLQESPSEISLKLATGDVDDGGAWGGAWDGHRSGSVGGPLAEALRSSPSVSDSSGSGFLHQLAKCQPTETSFLST